MRLECHSFSGHRLLILNPHGLFFFHYLRLFFMAIGRVFLQCWAWNLRLIWVCFGRFIGQIFIFIRVFMNVGFFVFTQLGQVDLIFWYWLFTFWLNWAQGRVVLPQRFWYPFWEVHQRRFFICYYSRLPYSVHFQALYHWLFFTFCSIQQGQCFRVQASWIIFWSSFGLSLGIIKI